VRIPTYNRGKIITKRTIPSILKQTYQNFEIIIVGDHCTDDTQELIEKFNDDRINFYNLPEQGSYPTNLPNRWQVAGTIPANYATKLCSGEWIAPLDDDDEFSKEHIEILLNFALENEYEFVYGKVKREIRPNEWIDLGSFPLRCGRISHMSVLYSSMLKFFEYDVKSWKYNEPADWNMWRRMKEAGVKIGFLDKIVGNHYLERTQRGKLK
jgi:glycosyltransferase involved in cell wall biosynthesis